MNDEVTNEQFKTLKDRVKVIEDKLDPPGDGPTVSQKLESIERRLEKAITQQNTYVTKDELEVTIEKVVADLKQYIEELKKAESVQQPMPSPGNDF